MNTGIEIRQDLISATAGEHPWADRLARILGEIGRCSIRNKVYP